jgi:hypothetical protein
MARPKPEIIISSNVTDLMTVDVLKADHLYTVLYNNQAINIRQRYWSAQGETIKYLKTTYANLASAENLAIKLNKDFVTDKFTVKEVI